MLDDSLALTVDGSWTKQMAPNRWWEGTVSYSHECALLVTITLPDAIIWAKSRTLGGAPLNTNFYLHDLGHDGSGTQVMFRVGDGWT
jgi:hypothetical protein